MMLQQNYDQYTLEDQEIWRLLFERQEKNFQYASEAYCKGVSRMGFSDKAIPEFKRMNKILNGLTGWEVSVVPGWIPEYTFFNLLYQHKFPSSTWLRKKEQIDYLEEPDMFHDVFGHVPLLTNQDFVNFLFELSKLGLDHLDNSYALELLARVYWYTVEFGLIMENNRLKIYGAGIISSPGETIFSISKGPRHRTFDVESILDSPFKKDVFQDQYFIIDDYAQLYNSVADIRKGIDKRIVPTYH